MRGTGPSAGRSPRGRAILLLDLTRDRLRPDAARPVPAIAALRRFVQGELDYFRERGRPVVHVRTRGDAPGAPADDFDEPFAPRPGELVIEKVDDSAFAGTELATRLAALDVGQITLTGIETQGSVRATALAAVDLGYRVVVPDTCVASSQPEAHRAALRELQEARARREASTPSSIPR